MKSILSISLMAIILFFLSGCGQGKTEKQEKSQTVEKSKPEIMERTGIIESGDPTDPDHGNLAYDPYTFNADFGDKVMVLVKTENFDPLLKLVEVSTGAVLAEWDPKYSEGEGLSYTIAGPGKYEARVYAIKNGTGNYSLIIIK